MKCPMPVYGVPGLMVAPVRERGLKLKLVSVMELKRLSRSREGAWIEIKSNRFWFNFDESSLP